MAKLRSLFTWKALKLFLIRFTIAIVSLELGLMLCSYMNWIDIHRPTYTMSEPSHFLPHFDKDIGYLHQPNGQHSYSQSCFNVTVPVNDSGFVGGEHKKHVTGARLMIVGDSFTEGYGVSTDRRFSALLNSQVSTPTINLGVSDKGPAQYLQIYKKFGKHYQHDALLIGIYPANDFYDDLETITRAHWEKSEEKWILQPPSPKLSHKPEKNWFKKLLKNYTYLYNTYLYIKTSFRENGKTSQLDHFNYSADNWERIVRTLTSFKEHAPDKCIAVFSVPSKEEIMRDDLKQSPFSNQLIKLCDSLEIEYLPLIEHIGDLDKVKRQELYHDCDSHWSPKGHKEVSEFILKNWSYFSKKD